MRRVVVTLRREARARRAAVRRRPADLLAGLLRDAAVRRIDAGYRRSARGPYKVGKFEAEPLHRIRARQGLVGRRPAGRRGSYNFDIVRYEFYRDRDVAFEGFTGKNYLFREEFTSRIWATRYDFPGHQGRPRQARDAAGRDAVGRAGLVHQHAARQVQGSARARGADQRLRFRMDQQDHHVRRLCAHASRCSRTPT